MTWEIINGHTIDEMNKLPEKSIQTIITSPPYWSLRAYGTNPQIWGGDNTCEHMWANQRILRPNSAGGHSKKQETNIGSWSVEYHDRASYAQFCTKCSAWRGELGSEPTPELFIEHLMLVFDACWRVLRDDGIFWVNIADSYAGAGGNGYKQTKDKTNRSTGKDGNINLRKINRRDDGRIKPQSMCMVPERMLLAMAERGWILRSKIRLVKTSAMPESVRNRPSNATEELYMFTKVSSGYFYDQDAVRQNTGREMTWDEYNRKTAPGATWESGGITKYAGHNKTDGGQSHPAGANLKNWWYWTPEPATYEFCTNCDGFYDGIALRSLRSKKFSGSNEKPCVCGKEEEHTAKVCPNCGNHHTWHNHYAVFPTWLPERCIKAATSVHGACAKCNSPWERVIEKTNERMGKSRGGNYGGEQRTDGTKVMANNYQAGMRYKTIDHGFQPTCKCDCEEVVPCKVLDIFSGSGTTALVADRLGRHGLGIELNSHYYALSLARIKSDAPLVAAVEEQEKMVQKGLFE